MTNGTDGMSVDKLTRVYIKIRDARAKLAADFKTEDDALNDQLTLVKRALLDYCTEHGVESVRTAEGVFYRTTKTRYWTSDWESMHKFIFEHELPEFFEKRLNQTAVKQFLEENPESVPPGLNTDVEYVVTVRKK
jgi:predicted metal-dependent phosphotriesterase family hydrolase